MSSISPCLYNYSQQKRLQSIQLTRLLCEFLRFRPFELGNASHRLLTHDTTTPVTAQLHQNTIQTLQHTQLYWIFMTCSEINGEHKTMPPCWRNTWHELTILSENYYADFSQTMYFDGCMITHTQFASASTVSLRCHMAATQYTSNMVAVTIADRMP